MNMIRLDKYISVATGVSRSDARTAIKKGSVTVDGAVVKSIDFKLCGTETVTVNGAEAVYREFIYIVMNKPKGVLSASSDKRARTVIDLVPERYSRYELFPVGRLDKDTTGLLLITNDGDFAHRVISPKSNIDKLYEAVLDGDITEEHINAFKEGITLADGTACLPARLIKTGECRARITIREGKYHQIKRMFGVVGLGVNELKRLSIGKFLLPEDIAEGCCREIFEDEICLIFK